MMKIAIIDGTGRERPEKLKPIHAGSPPDTPGENTAKVYSGVIDGLEVFYVSGQDKDGEEKASTTDYISILQVLKDQGCEAVISASTCASLHEEICPGECLIPNAFMDMTKDIPLKVPVDQDNGGEGPDRHKDLFSDELRDHMTEAAIIRGITVHNKGTVITVRKDKELTQSELSQLIALKGDVIDRSTSPEAFAASVMGLPYARAMLCTTYASPELNQRQGAGDELKQKVDTGYRKIMQILAYAIKKVQQEELTD